MPLFYFAWTDEGEAFNAAVHATDAQYVWDGVIGEGNEILSLEVEEREGEFPTLTIELRNPGVGLLGAGRNRWCWLSADDGSGPEPIFTGRLIGIPKQLAGEVAELQFVARPPDWVAQKAAIADGLRVLPWWDPVWLQDSVDDDDAVLETRTAAWHYNRTSLAVSTTDLLVGEAGTIEVGEGDHLYDDFDVGYSESPLRRIAVTGTVSWMQSGAGDVDLTHELVNAFRDAGSPHGFPIVSSLTGDGLLSSWPAALDDIGGGWTVGAASTIEAATWLQEKAYVVQYLDKPDDMPTTFQVPDQDIGGLAFSGYENWEAAFTLGSYRIHFEVHYEAARQRSETIRAVIEADVQDLLVEPGADEEASIELTSEFVGQPIDAGGALPIGDLRRNSYFRTDRGCRSFEYLLLLARAQLAARARAVEIRFVTPWSIMKTVTCRHSVHLEDRRLPGGEATGKVRSYSLSASGEGEIRAEVTIGCTIGYGVALGAAASGTPVYAEDGILEDGIQARIGAQSTLIAGELLYEDMSNFEITDDDGVNLFDMTPRTVVNSITVAGGPAAQRTAIDDSLDDVVPDPVGALSATPTVVTLDLKPVAGGDFHVDFEPEVSELVIVKSIDLEAA